MKPRSASSPTSPSTHDGSIVIGSYKPFQVGEVIPPDSIRNAEGGRFQQPVVVVAEVAEKDWRDFMAELGHEIGHVPLGPYFYRAVTD